VTSGDTGESAVFFAPGKPETKGSAKAFMPKGARFPVVTNDNPRAKSWAGVVALAAREAMQGRAVARTPVLLCVSFYMPRPRSHYGTGKNAATLKPGAPVRHETRPDLDKMLRCVKDAITGVVYADDGLVWKVEASKHYGDSAGVSVGAYW
jgi:Holliday junction resolvase RusA-like endonuclease